MRASRSILFQSVVLCGLSLSLGWGIRGNFGHSHGAMIPGALAALAAVAVSGREDWWRRAGYFGMFGALGWAFGGRMSYMMVLSYTHSGHWPSQLYGYACICVIGFLWAALGGAWTALPACLSRERLTGMIPPILVVLLAWLVKNLVLTHYGLLSASNQRHENPLYWHDTSWVDALVALYALLAYAVVEQGVLRRRPSWGTRFLLYLAGGWWVAFVVVIVILVDFCGFNFRMTPPRGDDWVGTLGMVAGALVFFLRCGMVPAARVLLVTGFFGGLGFAGAEFLQHAELKYVPLLAEYLHGQPNWATNWHSLLEQTYGLFNGIGLGVAMYALGREPDPDQTPAALGAGQPASEGILPADFKPAPPAAVGRPTRRWTEVVAVGFVLLFVTYINQRVNVPNWVRQNAVDRSMHFLAATAWFDVFFGATALAVTVLLVRHVRRPLAVVPASPLGKCQLLFLVVMWWMVLANWMQAIPHFAAQRLVTEGVIQLNAVCCTLLVLLWPRPVRRPDRVTEAAPARSLVPVALAGVVAFGMLTAGAFWGTREMHGDNWTGYGGNQKRFGPDAPAPRPERGKQHP
jgi:hypothetical protein